MISVIVPAHNEEVVIARGLRAIVSGAEPGELEVIVACNGCADDTAAIARGFGPPVLVVEIPAASKVAALNAADEVATGSPRFYVDADVVLNLAAIRKIAAELNNGSALMATPELKLDLSGSGLLVRAYYSVWTYLPYNHEHGAVGTGVFVLSAAGRARFGRFPPVLGDDGYVRALFYHNERATVRGASSHVTAPRTVAALLRIHTRTRLGHYHLLRAGLNLPTIQPQRFLTSLRLCICKPSLWILTPIYLILNLLARYRASRQLKLGAIHIWERDDTSRDLFVPVQAKRPKAQAGVLKVPIE